MPKKIISLLLIIILMFSVTSVLSSCGRKHTEIRTVSAGIYPDRSATPGYRSVTSGNYKTVISDNDRAFMIDERTGSIAVKDPYELRSTLPFFNNTTASVFTVKVFNEKEYVFLDSQRNCAAYGTFSYTCEGNRVKAVYTLANNETTAKRSPDNISAGDIYIRLPVEYVFENDILKVSINMAECVTPDDLIIESIAFMPYFCSAESGSTESADDYILVPDGCGAIIYTKNSPADYNEKSFSVYGSTAENSHYAPFGAFGIKHGNSAVAAAVTAGEAIAEIRTANASAKTSQMNIVYPEFRITDTVVSGGKVSFASGYKGLLEVDYRFLDGQNADYIGMASAVRAMFIYSGKLPDRAENDNGYTVNIEIDGSTDGTQKNNLSSYEDIEDLLSVLKAKNINNANILLNGFFEGGLIQNELSSVRLTPSAGSKKDFVSLCEYAEKQGYGIYPATNLMYFSGAVKQASDPAGNTYSVYADITSPVDKTVSAELKLTRLKTMEKNCISLMNFGKKQKISGFLLNDTDKPFVADVNSGVADKQAASDIISENVASFGVLGNSVLNGCGMNVLRGADVCVNVPYYTSFEENEFYKAVPFVQAVIHSSVVYSGQPANMAALPTLELLKTAEYGGVPFFRWTMNNSSVCYYENMFNEAVEFCTEAADRLSDLSMKRITGHREVESGIFCTEYDFQTLVYVNYNNYSVNIGEIAVMPYDYIRIN